MLQTPSSRQTITVFLCHGKEDKPAVCKLYTLLSNHGIKPWFDEIDLLPGQDWFLEIKKAIRSSDLVLACLSKGSIGKTGFVQREIKFALDAADERPEGEIFIIPVRIEECDVPDRLSGKQWVDLFVSDGKEKLLSSIKNYASRRGIPLLEGNTTHSLSGSEALSIAKFDDSGLMERDIIVDIPGLERNDSVVLKISCEYACDHDRGFWIDTSSIIERAAKLTVGEEELYESLEILNDTGYIQSGGESLARKGIYAFTVTTAGFMAYAQVCVLGYNALLKDVAVFLSDNVSESNQPSVEDASVLLSKPKLLVEHAFDVFEEKEWLKQAKFLGGTNVVISIKTQLKRWARSDAALP